MQEESPETKFLKKFWPLFTIPLDGGITASVVYGTRLTRWGWKKTRETAQRHKEERERQAEINHQRRVEIMAEENRRLAFERNKPPAPPSKQELLDEIRRRRNENIALILQAGMSEATTQAALQEEEATYEHRIRQLLQ